MERNNEYGTTKCKVLKINVERGLTLVILGVLVPSSIAKFYMQDAKFYNKILAKKIIKTIKAMITKKKKKIHKFSSKERATNFITN